MSEEYEWTPFGESLNGDDAEDVSIVHTFSRLTGTSTTKTKLSWQGGWTQEILWKIRYYENFPKSVITTLYRNS